MVRTRQLLHPQTPPATTRAAATVLLLRDGPGGLEVLMTRRSAQASFAPGAYVFPGGVIDPQDAACHDIADRRATQSDHALTQAIGAIRESFEEVGVLLARHADGRLADDRDIAALDRQAPFADQCRSRGLTLAADGVYLLAHWITDRDMPKRFDVPFLVARMPAGQEPVADESEQFEPVWIRPGDALVRHGEGSFSMIFPTVRTLERLSAYTAVDALLAACASERPLWTSCPRSGFLAGEVRHYMEHETAYGELALVSPDGRRVHHLDWQHERPVPLLAHVQRLTAGNPGMMTGPGTNTYLVGEASTGWLVLDPGPDDATHLERIMQATGGDVRLIVCTHSHPDHSPGARPLQARCPKRPPVLGLAARETALPAWAFTPDRELADGEALVLEDGDRASLRHTLRVVHTPGHAANHLCLILEEDGLLFSGDHILNGSTTVVGLPDGDMSHYLRSLDRLHSLCGELGIEFILPAHGYVLADAASAIARLKAHRLAREDKVLQAMRARPQGGPDDWVPLAYADTPSGLWPVAKRSLMAHVARIQALGLHP
jgi:glyoxylase-like metal-dependent hydrolase (beta-lactamase superfamily II)/8-oxo-dGTP pyrophosphatase MutT (NUDIX family)